METTADTAIDMSFEVCQNRRISRHSTCKFQVHASVQEHYAVDFRPVLNYFQQTHSNQTKYVSGEFELVPADLQYMHTISDAVGDILHHALGLYDVNKEDIQTVARYINIRKPRSQTSPFNVVAKLDIQVIHSHANFLRPSALVRVEDVNDGLESCSVCLEGFGEGERADEEVYKTHCSHMFHCGCIGKWLTKKAECPMCRSVLLRRVSVYSK